MTGPGKDRKGLWLLFVLLLTFAIHAPSIQNDFVFDDPSSASSKVGKTDKPHEMVAEFRSLGTYFTSHYLRGSAETSRGFRPITVLSYAAVYQLMGRHVAASREAMPQHAVNVALQTLNTWLVFVLIVMVTGRRGAALLGALVFGVHAIHSGPVASIVGRGELLAFGFGAGAAIQFLCGLRDKRQARWGIVVPALLLWLAFCSKESAVAWLAFLPLLELARRQLASEPLEATKVVLRALAVSVVPFAVFLALYVNATWHLEYQPDYVGNPLFYMPALERVTHAVVIWGYAAYKVLFPFSPSCDYGPNVLPVVDDYSTYRAIGVACVIASVLVVAGVFARRRPLFALAAAAFFGFSFITSNLPFALETIFAERLLYTPSIGVSFLVAGIALSARGSVAKGLLAVLFSWCAVSAFVTVDRMFVWSENKTLFEHDAETNPRSLRLLVSRIAQLPKDGTNAARRLQLLEQVLEVEPEFPLALVNLGTTRKRAGDKDAARRLFERGLASSLLDKGFRHDEGAHLAFNIGVLHYEDGNLVAAEKRFEEALRYQPRLRKAWFALLRMQLTQGRLQRMAATLARAHAFDPNEAVFEMFGGLLAAKRGDHRAAARLLGPTLPPSQEAGHAGYDDWLVWVESLLQIGEKKLALRVLQEGGRPPAEYRTRADALRRRLR